MAKFWFGFLFGLALMYYWQAYGDTALDALVGSIAEVGEEAQREVGAPTADSGW